MAFQQPARQAAQRVARSGAAVESSQQSSVSALEDREHDLSQTSWVLFFPPTEVATESALSESEHSLDIAGRSRINRHASFDTAARSSQVDDFRLSIASSSVAYDVSVEEDAELDSLDSHLPDFRSQPAEHGAPHRNSIHALPVLPAHDGLGSFRLDRPAISQDAQEQIYQFERFNPKRLRIDNAGGNYMEPDAVEAQEVAKRERIEAWRLEHSRVLLDEVQRETRRRQKSLLSMHRQYQSQTSDDNLTWHDEDAAEAPSEHGGFLSRITRAVARDIFGIDEKLLETLLGEAAAIHEDEDDVPDTPRASQFNSRQLPASLDDEPWQLRMLENVSKELGKLVHRLSPHHPGAFSTYARMQQMPLPYAGLPVIPEAGDQTSTDQADTRAPTTEFQPTMNHKTIPGRAKSTDAADDGGTFTKEEWERELDIKLVFRYLMSRFTSRSSGSMGNGSHMAPCASSMQDAAARVARVRQHHPLIARAKQMERRPLRAMTTSNAMAARARSSCASQSTRRSARRSSTSSRHYWDIGSSLGTSSMIGPQGGPMGSWGEV